MELSAPGEDLGNCTLAMGKVSGLMVVGKWEDRIGMLRERKTASKEGGWETPVEGQKSVRQQGPE